MHLSVVCPRMGVVGGGGGATHGKFDIFSFEISNSHDWGELIGTHNSLYCSTELLQRVIITWWQKNNGTHKRCAYPLV